MGLTKITSRILDSSGVTILGTIATGVWEGTAIADDHIASAATWNTASTDRLKWDGGATGLTASTGRTSLGLGTVATTAASDYATAAQGTKADSAQQPPSEGAFANGDKTKLDAIEASADVTDTTNVTSAGALMDSEVTNLTQVKAFDSTDYVKTTTDQTIAGVKTFSSNITVGDGHFIGDDSFDNLLLQSSSGENLNVSSANDVIFYTGGTSPSSLGTQGLRIFNSSGNATFSGGVTISGANNTASKLILTNTASSNTWSFNPEYNSQNFTISEDANPRITLKSGGNVGIGTTSALGKLSIGSGSFADTNVVAQMSTGGGGTGAYFGYNKNGSYGLLVGMSNGLDGWTAGVIRQITTDPLYFIVNSNTIAMNINSGGNVGIGIAPSSKFQVNDGANKNLAIKVGQTDSTAIMLNAYNDASDANIPMEFRASSFAFENGILQAKSGIAFPNQSGGNTRTVASSTLDAYEEGTYTATASPSTGTITLSTSYNTLTYTKIGRVVTVTGYCYVSSVSSPTGTISISLPFNQGSGLTFYAACSVGFNGVVNSALNEFWSQVASNTILIYRSAGTSVSGSSAQQMQAGSDFRVSATYFI